MHKSDRYHYNGIKTLSLCLIAGVAATIVTFSQEAPKPVVYEPARDVSHVTFVPADDAFLKPWTMVDSAAPTEPAAVELQYQWPNQSAPKPVIPPADNVALNDINGHSTIYVTVLSISDDKKSIKIRTREGKEMTVLMSTLDRHTASKFGVKNPPSAKEIANDKIAVGQLKNAVQNSAVKSATDRIHANAAKTSELLKSNREKQVELGKLSAKELQTRILKKDPDALNLIFTYNHTWEEYAYYHRNDPQWLRFNLSPASLFAKMEIKPDNEPEKVSLRPKFEKLGVRAAKQIGGTCTVYSAHHLFQYACLSAGWPALSIDELKRRVIPDPRIERGQIIDEINALNATSPKRVTTQWLGGGMSRLTVAAIKHLLRQGKACRIGEILPKNAGDHAEVVVGFETHADGTTTWELLNSNRVEVDKGYHKEKWKIWGDFSVWFE